MKKDMPLEGLRWSRDSGSALYETPLNGRSRTGWGGDGTEDKGEGGKKKGRKEKREGKKGRKTSSLRSTSLHL